MHVCRLLTRLASVAAVFLSVGGCGGGGGALPFEPPAVVVPGLAGTVMLPDANVGRIGELEPNDVVAQAHELPAMSPRCQIEVTGELGESDVHFGRTDVVDSFRIVCLTAQEVTLALTYAPTDPVGGFPNDIDVSVFETASGTPVASGPGGAQPRETTFSAAALTAYDVLVGLVPNADNAGGHAPYVLAIATTDPQGSPKPSGTSTLVGRGPPARPVAAPARAYAADEPECDGTHVLVRMRDGADATAVCERHDLQAAGRTAGGSYRLSFDCSAEESGPRKAVSLCAAIETDPNVLWAEPDWIVRTLADPADPHYGRQWNLRAVGAPGAWPVSTGDAAISIGLIDTGCVDHPDLAGRIAFEYDFISDPDRAGDGDGRDIDATDDGDMEQLDGSSSWHGTHLAAIMVANHDGVGMSGMAPGCTVTNFRAIGRGGGLVSDVADAILFAAGLASIGGFTLPDPLPILNLSLGLVADSAELRDACDRAFNRGVFVVGAVGNTGGFVLYPARYASVFAVAGVDQSHAPTGYSNFGEEVEIAAPSGALGRDVGHDGWPDGIFSACVDETVIPSAMSYRYYQGTSQAAPHVAAAAALLLSIDPTLTSIELRELLTTTARDVSTPGQDDATGAGLLQVQRAVNAALQGLGTPRADPPWLLLPTATRKSEGFELMHEVAVYNGGGGSLTLGGVDVLPDDGGTWLEADLRFPTIPRSDINATHVEIRILRQQLPLTPARYSGTVRIYDTQRVIGTIRVIAYVTEFARAGFDLSLVALEEATGIARAGASASADRGYRYFLRGLVDGDYRIKAGEDRNADGLFCQEGDSCGWYGGPTEPDAVLVPFDSTLDWTRDLDVDVVPQGP